MNDAAIEASLLPGVNVLLEGPTGTGKTYSIGTAVDAGVETFFLSLEAGMESLIAYWTDRNLPVPPNLHWHRLSSIDGGFEWLADAAEKIGALTYESLTKMQDYTRAQNNQFEKLLRVLCNFTDQRTGKEYGPVDKWGPDKLIVIDGLTGFGTFAMQMQVGKKPVSSPSDYMVAQGQVERALRMLCEGCQCHFILIAHVEREIDQIMGGSKVTVATLGKALPPKIPPMFSDVILAVRNGTEFLWSTANSLVDLKTRNLPLSEKIPPDFQAIFSKWRSRGGRFSSTVKA
jgi:AAA domain